MKRNTFVEIIALLFIVLFLYTGISKLLDYDIFKEQIETSPVLATMSRYIAILLPITEIFVSVILFISRFRLQGFYAALGLMVLFTAYIIYMMNFNEHLPCSCGGVIEFLSWKGHIIFNSIFIGLAIIGIMLDKKIRIKRSVLSSN